MSLSELKKNLIKNLKNEKFDLKVINQIELLLNDTYAKFSIIQEKKELKKKSKKEKSTKSILSSIQPKLPETTKSHVMEMVAKYEDKCKTTRPLKLQPLKNTQKDFRYIIFNNKKIQSIPNYELFYKGLNLNKFFDEMSNETCELLSTNELEKKLENKFKYYGKKDKYLLKYKLNDLNEVFYIPYDDNFLLNFKITMNNMSNYLTLEISLPDLLLRNTYIDMDNLIYDGKIKKFEDYGYDKYMKKIKSEYYQMVKLEIQ